eukprot:CAMPEP_0118918546 /NCGR_PEP_ID=MMETSP1166-20130328/17993_1 /TAXON_ID=1104430 /ORGANISM="Chrysoreinhardia sp, Strain CCMP3193" /LENGTH=70 /DNA_ID=CAMNT_0006858873 /DNA_START=59 /DNA_END=271 /DNA_ORIENTATION=+
MGQASTTPDEAEAESSPAFPPSRPPVCPRYEPGAYDEATKSSRSRYADEIWHSTSRDVDAALPATAAATS